MASKLFKMIDNNPVKVMLLMMIVIVVGAIVTTGLLDTDESEERFNELLAVYEFLTDEESGIASWTTEETWKTGLNQMIDLCPKEAFTKTGVHGDNEALRQMIRNIRRVKFNDVNREEVAALVMELEIRDTSKGNKHRLEIVDKDLVDDINYLCGVRMVY